MPDIPTAPARLIPPKKTGDAYTWKLLSCPHCGEQHTHGAGERGNLDGHRTSHCTRDNPGYIIVKVNPGD
jgi:hypothetical protein